MTSIEYGGGPTLEQRQNFCNLDGRGHIPGYMGFCPQIKYKYGKTYGNETAEITKEIPYYNGPLAPTTSNLPPRCNYIKDRTVRFNLHSTKDDLLIPKSTGDNKYIEDMIPGYSGDIPRFNYKFGSTYKTLCDESIDEFVRDYYYYSNKQNELKNEVLMKPKLRTLSHDPHVRDNMNTWTDDLFKRTASVQKIKGSTEPPIPGYQGFIPRVENTEAGLGHRFHKAAQKGLEKFRDECDSHFKRIANPITCINTLPVYGPPLSSISSDGNRIFHQDGMIPDYQGHIHGYQNQFGDNFGNATRNLEVCAHPLGNYGEYLMKK